MNSEINPPWPAGEWKKLLAEAVTEVEELLRLLDLDSSILGESGSVVKAADSFRLRVPRGFIERMRRGDPKDPLLRQVLPTGCEIEPREGFGRDPVGELGIPPADGILHKYSGRALLMVTGVCPVHCRYCFRRHFPYADHGSAGSAWDGAIRKLAADPGISEVILSGGDPLSVPDARLEPLSRELAGLPQVKRIRIHTRVPIVLPQRVDGALVAWIGDLGLPTVVVVHVNHANEIDDEVRRALAALRRTGVTLLNQSVLLRGVNDSVEALVDLSEELMAAGVLPYYLHLLDPVAGAAHFDLGPAAAREVFSQLCSRLPGYLVPRLVREIPGAPSKVGVDLWE